jgi:DNA/RNA endonuclease G (NUC1)
MANIAIFKSGQTPEYLQSVNGAEYMVDPTALEGNIVPNSPDVIFNPDVSAVINVPRKFWKRVGNIIVEMTQSEKDIVLAAELQAKKNNADSLNIQDMKVVLAALIKLLNTKLPANKQITKQEMIDALKGEIV